MKRLKIRIEHSIKKNIDKYNLLEYILNIKLRTRGVTYLVFTRDERSVAESLS